jgi:DNA-binding transcriptional regulator YbjK
MNATTAIVTKTNGHHSNGHMPPVELTPPIEQVHGLLNASIEQIAGQWIEQLTVLRENATALEAQLLACVAQTKSSIERLHELGAQVAAEATRGQEVIAKLSDGIAQIAGE